jgi:hypothetical protein
MPFDDNIGKSVEHPTNPQLETYLRRMLNPDETYAVGQHLATCDECRIRLQQQPEVRASLDWLQAELRMEQDALHLSYEMAVEIAGGAPAAEDVAMHLEACADCRADVDELRALRNELARSPAAAVATSPPKRTLPFYQRVEWQIAAALLVAAGLGAYVLKVRQPAETSLRVKLKDDGGMVAIDSQGRLVTPHPYPAEYLAAVSRTVDRGTLDIPAEYSGAGAKREQLLGPAHAQPTFELNGPVGIAVESMTPTFRWQALPNATSYSVAVYGRGYQRAVESGGLRETEWTPGTPLARDASYTWTVTATIAGKRVLAPIPPAAEARFRVISEGEATAIDKTRQGFPDAHLLLAVMYARMGLTPESTHELELLQKANPESALAKKLLAQIRGQEPSPTNTNPAQ